MTLSITKLCHYAECYCVDCRDLLIGMLNVIMLSAVRLNVVMLSVVEPIKILLGWIGPPGTNILVYYEKLINYGCKKFYNISPCRGFMD